MTTLRDDILPIFEDVRTLIHDLGLRQFDVMMRVKTWSGDRVGKGTATVVDTPLTLSTGARVKVKELNAKDIMASGGRYADGDFKVGPFTPQFSGGGRGPEFLEPAVGSDPTEVMFRIDGPGMIGVWCKKIDTDTDRNFAYFITLRRTNLTSP